MKAWSHSSPPPNCELVDFFHMYRNNYRGVPFGDKISPHVTPPLHQDMLSAGPLDSGLTVSMFLGCGQVWLQAYNPGGPSWVCKGGEGEAANTSITY